MCPQHAHPEDRKRFCRCNAGFFSAEPQITRNTSTERQCAPCAPGTYKAVLGAGECLLCPEGTYSAALNATSVDTCAACTAGRNSHRGAASAAECTDVCPPGFEGRAPVVSCTRCADTEYKAVAGNVQLDGSGESCLPCNAASTSAGLAVADHCACNAGYQPAPDPSADPDALPAAGQCEPCPFGTYKTDTNNTACTACPAGTFRVQPAATSLQQCTVCPRGQYSELAGRSACFGCQAGTYGAPGADTRGNQSLACLPCGAGTYSGVQGAASNSTCDACLPGKFSTAFGATSENTCQSCGRGTYNDADGASVCTACPAGTYNNNVQKSEIGACTLCPMGTYNPNTSSVSEAACRNCPRGTYNSQQGATDRERCENCRAGTYGNTERLVAPVACTECGKGKYSPAPGATSADTCQDCGLGQYLDATGATSAEQCVYCPVGTFSQEAALANIDKCLACLPGYYCIGENLIAACAPNATSPPGSNAIMACACRPGYYAPVDASATCVACGQDEFCVNGSAFACPAHTSTYATALAASAAACRCAPGFAQDPLHTDGPCAPCPGNQTCTGTGLAAPCPSPEHTSAPGASSVENCTCAAPDTGSDGGTCVYCAAGKFAFDAESTTCIECRANRFCTGGEHWQRCPDNSIARAGSRSHDACVCREGYARNESAPGLVCVACAEVIDCPQPLTDAGYRVDLVCTELGTCWRDAYLTPIAAASEATETKIDEEDSSFTTPFRVPKVVSAAIQSGENIEVRSHVHLNATVSVRRALALCGHARTVHDLLAHAQHAVETTLRAGATEHEIGAQDPHVRVAVTGVDATRGEALLSAEIEYHTGTHPRSTVLQSIEQVFNTVPDLCAGAARAMVPVRSEPLDPASSVVTAPPLQREYLRVCAVMTPDAPCLHVLGNGTELVRVQALLDTTPAALLLLPVDPPLPETWRVYAPGAGDAPPVPLEVFAYAELAHAPLVARPESVSYTHLTLPTSELV